MKCRHCKINIVLDEDHEWVSNEEDDIGKYQTPLCFLKKALSTTKRMSLSWHQPDYFKTYYNEVQKLR